MSIKDSQFWLKSGQITLTNNAAVNIVYAPILATDVVQIVVLSKIGANAQNSYSAVITGGVGFAVTGGGANDVSVIAYSITRPPPWMH